VLIAVRKDVQSGLASLSVYETCDMLKTLKGYKILEGVRGSEGIPINLWVDMIVRVSRLVCVAPQIREMDLNPVLGTKEKVVAVDARIRIEK